jgi:hypothetical protein
MLPLDGLIHTLSGERPGGSPSTHDYFGQPPRGRPLHFAVTNSHAQRFADRRRSVITLTLLSPGWRMTYLSLSGPAGSNEGQSFKADKRSLVCRGPDGRVPGHGQGLQIYRRPSSWALLNASWRDEMVSF